MIRFYWYKLSASFSRHIGRAIRDSKREVKYRTRKFKSLQKRILEKEVYYIYIITTEKYRDLYDRARNVKIL